MSKLRPQSRPALVMAAAGVAMAGALGIATLTLPSILDGWQTAVALAATSTRQASVTLPLWTVAFIVGCLSLGGVYSAWSRR